MRGTTRSTGRRLGVALLAIGLVAVAASCDGEDRPGVEVIDEGGSGTGTGTGTGTGSGTGTASGTGEFPEGVVERKPQGATQVDVTLTIQKSPQPIVKKATIDIINSGETKTVTFRDFPQPPFGTRTTVKVEVAPVPGEKRTSNNTAEYPVIFSLG